MAFKAIIHGPDNKESYKKIIDSIAEFRVEKTFKALKSVGIQSDTVLSILNENNLGSISNLKTTC